MSDLLKLASPLTLLAGVSFMAGPADATLITVTPNADFSATPYNLSFDGGSTVAYTLYSDMHILPDINTYANSVGIKPPMGSSSELAQSYDSAPSLPVTGATFASGSAIGLKANSSSDYFYALQFYAGGNTFDGYIEVTNGTTLTSVTYDNTPVPEPASLALLATGAAGLLALRRRRNVGAEQG